MAFCTLAIQAQEGPHISSAILEFDRNNDLVAAKKYIDEAKAAIEAKAGQGVSEKNMKKFNYYMGAINLKVATSNDPAIASLNPNALDEAELYLVKTIESEHASGKKTYSDRATYDMYALAGAIFQRGIGRSDAGDNAGASDDFLKVFELKKGPMSLGVDKVNFDTTAYYNSIILAERAANLNDENKANRNESYLKRAIDGNKALLEWNYKGIAWTVLDIEKGSRVAANNKVEADAAVASGKYADPQSSQPVTKELYKALIRLYQSAGDNENYKATLSKAREMYPEDEGLVRIELQTYLDSGDFEAALKNLDIAIAQEADNKLFYYVKAVILHTNMNKPAEAITAYDAAIALDPNYADALYMKGLLYINSANAIIEKMNALPLNATKQYEAMKKEQNAEFEKALPLFEKAQSLNPTDESTLKALKEVYYRLGNYAKSKEMETLIQAIPAK